MFTTLYQDFMESWNDPHTRHALLVHAPIAFAGLGIVPVLAILLSGFKSPALKVFIVVWFLLASGGAYLAEEAGEAAEHSVEQRQPPLTDIEKAALERHEDLGENGWIWPLIPAGLVVLTLANTKKVAVPAGVLALVASLGVGGWVGLTAKAGGRLVYTYGVGVPPRGTSTDASPRVTPIPADQLSPPTEQPPPQQPPPAEAPATDPPPGRGGG